MATISAAERRKYRERQKAKQGIVPTPPPVVVLDRPQEEQVPQSNPPPLQPPPQADAPATDGGEPTNAVVEPSENRPAYKRPRLNLGLPQAGEHIPGSAWKGVMKARKLSDGPVDEVVRIVFDSRYPLNSVLNAAAGLGDLERATTLGIQQTLVAVKSYNHYASVLKHIVDSACFKLESEHRELKESYSKVSDELQAFKTKRDGLREDVGKYDREKLRLDGRVYDLTVEKKQLSSDLESVTKELEGAKAEVERCLSMLKRVADHFPLLGANADLAEAVDDLKGRVAAQFDKGFELALSQLKVVHPDLDVSQLDCYKVVVDGKIVDEEPAGGPELEMLKGVEDFLTNNEDLVGNGEEAAAHGVADDVVMEPTS